MKGGSHHQKFELKMYSYELLLSAFHFSLALDLSTRAKTTGRGLFEKCAEIMQLFDMNKINHYITLHNHTSSKLPSSSTTSRSNRRRHKEPNQTKLLII